MESSSFCLGVSEDSGWRPLALLNVIVQIVTVEEQAPTHFYSGNHALVGPEVECAFLDTQVFRRFLYAKQSFLHFWPVWLVTATAG